MERLLCVAIVVVTAFKYTSPSLQWRARPLRLHGLLSAMCPRGCARCALVIVVIHLHLPLPLLLHLHLPLLLPLLLLLRYLLPS
jgi:hypothetical protein